MVSLTTKINRLYIIIALLFAVCLTTITMCLYSYFLQPHSTTKKDCVVVQYPQIQKVQEIRELPNHNRDMRVLTDPLYPAYNRSDYEIHNSVVDAIDKKQLYNQTQENNDRFRLVAYVSSSIDTMDAGGNKWKLLARQKNRNQAEFFLVPIDKNYDLKVMLNNENVIGEKLRDVYTIPNQLTFKSPLLHDTPYDVVELPMTDFTSIYN
jgi:hypothetical protein